MLCYQVKLLENKTTPAKQKTNLHYPKNSQPTNQASKQKQCLQSQQIQQLQIQIQKYSCQCVV